MRELKENDLLVGAVIGVLTSFGGWYLLHDFNAAVVAGLISLLLVIFCEVLEVIGIVSGLLCAVVLVSYLDQNMDQGIAIGFISGVLYSISYGLIDLSTRIKDDLRNDGIS